MKLSNFKKNALSPLITAILMAASGSSFAQTDVVSFEFQGASEEALSIEFDSAVRLRWVIEQINIASDNEIYWPIARLIQVSGNDALNERKANVEAQLEALYTHWQQQGDSDKAATIALLLQQVKSWQLAYQPFRPIDLLTSRQQLDANPLIHPGQYILIAQPRPSSAYIYGSVSAHEVETRAGQNVRNYIRNVEQTQDQRYLSDRRSALLIRPGQAPKDVPWGLHNAIDTELLVGDILWVKPSHRVFTREYANLASEIPDLLRHWVGESEQSTPLRFEGEDPAVPHWAQQNLSPRRNHYGGVGLMQTPTARMAAEGETVLVFSDMEQYRRYSMSMQVLPWLQATAFYAQIPDRLYSNNPEFSGDNVLTDKGFDVKFRLWQEREWLPEVSVGFTDFAGTGLFDGEFVVASKRFGAFDVTLGAGFGRHGASGNISNPFCDLRDSFCARSSTLVGSGSQLDFQRYFRGSAGIFGSVEYQTPWEPLRVMLEYDANDYSQEVPGVIVDQNTPWNVGLNYQVTDWFDAALSYERGNTLMFNVVFRTNLATLSQTRVDRPRVEPRETPRAQSVDDVNWNALAHRISNNRTIAEPRFSMPDETTVRVKGHPWRYRDNHEAIDRSARILADVVPETITTYEFETLTAFQPMSLTSIDAQAFKQRIRNEDEGKGVNETVELFERSSPSFDYEPYEWLYDYPRRNRLGYGLKPFFNQDFGSPETFHFYQLGVKAFSHGWVARDLHLFGELGINLKNNYDRFNFDRDPFDLPLPRVRSDFRMHATNDFWVDRLQLTYFKRLSENVYSMAYGGYLERFFSGVGGEVLYREIDSPWAFGVNVNRVRQRDYNGWFGFESYETTTGHASVYYQMPWLKDSLLRLDVGRFLAGDDGVGVSFARRFESGVTVSAYASFTNVSSEDYGEGSFTHGFTLSIPFDLMTVRPTRQRVGMSWSPMSRDGGQPLWRYFELHGITDERNPFWSR